MGRLFQAMLSVTLFLAFLPSSPFQHGEVKKQERAWYLFSCEQRRDREYDRKSVDTPGLKMARIAKTPGS